MECFLICFQYVTIALSQQLLLHSTELRSFIHLQICTPNFQFSFVSTPGYYLPALYALHKIFRHICGHREVIYFSDLYDHFVYRSFHIDHHINMATLNVLWIANIHTTYITIQHMKHTLNVDHMEEQTGILAVSFHYFICKYNNFI